MIRSLYARFLLEHTPGINILETSKGYATYLYTDSNTVYIQDIYVLPQYRNSKYASKLANTIAFRAKRKGCKYLIGTVFNGAKDTLASKRVLTGYGMKLTFEGPQYSVFSKEIV